MHLYTISTSSFATIPPWQYQTSTFSIFCLLGSVSGCHVCGSTCCTYTSSKPYSGDSFSSTALLCWLILDEWNSQVHILIYVEISVSEWPKENAWYIAEVVTFLTTYFPFVSFRTLRNIANCLLAILDVLLVLLFMIAIFAVMGKVWKSLAYD